MAKMGSILLVAASALLLALGVILRLTLRALDLQVRDLYFVVYPRHLLLLSVVMFAAAVLLWRARATH